MRRILATTAIVCCLAAPVVAAQTTTSGRATSPGVFAHDTASMSELDASELLGKSVFAIGKPWTGGAVSQPAPGWTAVGQISDIVLSRDGKGPAVLVDVGGFLPTGGKTVAIKLNALQFVPMKSDASAFFIVLKTDKAAITKAPAFLPGKLGDWVSNGAIRPSGAAAATKSAGDKATDKVLPVAGSAAASATASDNEAVSTGSGTATGEQSAGTGQTSTKASVQPSSRASNPALAPAPRGYSTVDASTLTADWFGGMPVYGPNGTEIGSVAKAVQGGRGKVRFLVVDVGGFLGFGQRPVKLALADFSIQRQQVTHELRAVIGMTEAQLLRQPVYRG